MKDGQCRICPHYSNFTIDDEGTVTCKCKNDTYMDNDKCIECPYRSKSPAGSTKFEDCKCKKGLDMNEKGQCSTCPFGSTPREEEDRVTLLAFMRTQESWY